MSNLYWLSDEQFKKIEPLLPNDVRGVPRVDDRRVLSWIIHVIKRGLHWSDCPSETGHAAKKEPQGSIPLRQRPVQNPQSR